MHPPYQCWIHIWYLYAWILHENIFVNCWRSFFLKKKKAVKIWQVSDPLADMGLWVVEWFDTYQVKFSYLVQIILDSAIGMNAT